MQPNLTPSSSTPGNLWAGALSALLQHAETGCPHASRRAADLLERLAESPGMDRDLRELFERASLRLDLGPEPFHAPQR